MEQFLDFQNYAWDDDAEYQKGLIILRAKGPIDEDTRLMAQRFFYGKKFGIQIDLDEYRQWRDQAEQPANNSDADLLAAPPAVSYKEIVELIMQGRESEIPVKNIPDTVLGMDQTSQSAKEKRLKPWETAN